MLKSRQGLGGILMHRFANATGSPQTRFYLPDELNNYFSYRMACWLG